MGRKNARWGIVGCVEFSFSGRKSGGCEQHVFQAKNQFVLQSFLIVVDGL
jgi:hypothetical protein